MIKYLSHCGRRFIAMNSQTQIREDRLKALQANAAAKGVTVKLSPDGTKLIWEKEGEETIETPTHAIDS